ncbi:MAG: hypothetical protein FWH29_00025 [Methanobrevibacter sp.]|nr:hypothetical protein [Methanobrevibacter sp.]
MDSKKKANLLVIFIIAILGFGISNIAFIFTGEYIDIEIPEFNNDSQKLTVVDDGNFTPTHINQIKIDNTTNTTNETSQNDTEININNLPNLTIDEDVED